MRLYIQDEFRNTQMQTGTQTTLSTAIVFPSFVLSSVTHPCLHALRRFDLNHICGRKHMEKSFLSTITPLEFPAPHCAPLCTDAEQRWLLTHMTTQSRKCGRFLQAILITVSSTGIFYCPAVKCHLESHSSAGVSHLHPFTGF